MARDKPISDDFTDRSDQDYVSFLERQVLALRESRPEQSDLSEILRRLEALELWQSTQQAGAAANTSTTVPNAHFTSTHPNTGQLPGATGATGGHYSGGQSAGAVGDEAGDASAQSTLAVDPAVRNAQGIYLYTCKYKYRHIHIYLYIM